MPEGDSAYRAAAGLRAALVGRALTEFQVRTGALGGIDLTGSMVESVEPFGKHIFIRIGGFSLHSHMLMDGTWHVYKRGARWRRPGHQARVVLGNEQFQAVGFRVAQTKLIRTSEEPNLVGHLGPDVLKPDWDQGGFEVAVANIQSDSRPIHVALLDQSNVAGFGNEYANEICFLAGVDPRTPACLLNAEHCLRIGTRLIRANLNRVERTTTGNTRPGARLHIYGRAGSPCLRCGTPVRFTRLGADPSRERHVYWCPNCQPQLPQPSSVDKSPSS